MSVVMKKNDRRPTMTSTLTSDGEPINLTTASSVKFIMTPTTSTTPKVNAAASFDADRTTGGVSYSWAAVDTDTVGLFKAEWEITWGDGTKQTFPSDDYVYVKIVADLA